MLGGLGGAVAEALAEGDVGSPWTLRRIGVPSTFAKQVGDQAWLCDRYGLTEEKIVAAVKPILARVR